jgi:hypothetical protein
VIEDNTIEDIQAQLGFGLSLFGMAQMRVARNVIQGVATAGILMQAHAGPVLVEGNYVAPGPPRNPGAIFDIGNGIWVFGPQGGVAYIRRNQVVCEHPLADGIVMIGESLDSPPLKVRNSVIEQNQVTMHNSLFGGISLYGLASGNYVGQNQILGDGAYALQVALGFLPEDKAISNTFAGNNIALFQSSVADVFLDVNSMDNVLAGDSGTVMDLGTGNRITGYAKGGVGGGLGQDVQAAKRAMMQSLKALQEYSGPF